MTTENNQKTEQPTITSDDSKLRSTPVTQEQFDTHLQQLRKDLEKTQAELKDTTDTFNKSKFDLITMLGLFVGLITYLGVEIQVFKSIDNPLLIIGISIFFIASILLFILTINIVVKKLETVRLKDLINPLYIILLVLFVFSISFILKGYEDYSARPELNFLNISNHLACTPLQQPISLSHTLQ